MVRLTELILFVICILLSQYSIQAIIYSCNTTAPCGCSRNDAIINSRIVGGEPAAGHSWGWAVSLRGSNNRHFCGGTIISPRFILTAAHCVEDISLSRVDLTAVVGSDTLYDNAGQKIAVSNIYKHPKWNKITKENDIALLKLKKAISFKDPNIAKLCLPSIDNIDDQNFPFTNSNLVAIGWGHTEFSGSASSTLRQVTIKAVSNQERKCSNSINNIILQFCAAVIGGGKDTCQGDSGGALMYYSDVYKQWMIAGITSYGRGCGLSDYAGIYTRVSVYVDWIQSIVGHDGVVITGENSANIGVLSNILCIIVFSFSILIRSFY